MECPIAENSNDNIFWLLLYSGETNKQIESNQNVDVVKVVNIHYQLFFPRRLNASTVLDNRALGKSAEKIQSSNSTVSFSRWLNIFF